MKLPTTKILQTYRGLNNLEYSTYINSKYLKIEQLNKSCPKY